jgi:NAD(P)-dependent dehydrogenase (short-subunit alcohol dehydrogenase family)
MTTTVITGSASGMGAATKQRLAADGHRVIDIDIRDADIIADLSQPDARQRALDEVLARCEGRLDRLVLCAGVGGHIGDNELVVSVNYFGTITLLDGLLGALELGQAPSAVVIGSNSAKMVPAIDDYPAVAAMLDGDEAEARRLCAEIPVGDLVYMATKNALGRAVRRRAPEWGKRGVRLNAVAPGPIVTALLQGGLDTPGTGDAIRALPVPLDRFGEPAEVASVIAFMLSREASYMHGSIVYVDGGCDAGIRPDGY